MEKFGKWTVHDESPTITPEVFSSVISSEESWRRVAERLEAEKQGLLAALEAVRPCIEGYTDRCNSAKGTAAMKAVDDAISKATAYGRPHPLGQ